jgi:glycosyltransferase involved in cell wall biosynthesis
MHIGFDGKRAFQNKTGLGNYSRSLLTILSEYYPQHQYTLFAPKKTHLFNEKQFSNIHTITPVSSVGRHFPSVWRNRLMVKDIAAAKVDIYHGISNELPAGIEKIAVKKVVTVHDLIFERHPETYNFDERYVHRWKVKAACKAADAVIAISSQTKNDLVDLYKVPAKKIHVCYQCCNPIFQQIISAEEKKIIKQRYRLPEKYFLFVSSIAPRKNLIAVCKAMALLKDKLDIPLVVIGDGKKEKDEVKQFMRENGIADRLILLNELPQSKEQSFVTAADFPAIYQQALALIYPSIFEGFGLPILEALWSGTPVISSNTSSLPEVGGDAALYFQPNDEEQLAKHMLSIATDENLHKGLREKGLQQAQNFTPQRSAASIMHVYENIIR